MKNNIYLIALVPLALVAFMWYLSIMFEMASMPNDIGVLVGLLMAGVLIFTILFIINKITKTKKK